MARRAAVTPGTDPNPDADALADANKAAADAVMDPIPSRDSDLRAEVEELRRLVHRLGRNQIAQSMPEKVELPSMAEVLKTNPKMPVLSREGWFVPAIHPTDRIAKV